MREQPVRLTSVTFTSGDGATPIPSYLAIPDGDGPHPAVLILRGVAGPDDGYTEIACRLAAWGYATRLHGSKGRGAAPADARVCVVLPRARTLLTSVCAAGQASVPVCGFCRGGVR